MIQINNLTKRYGKYVAIENLSLDIPTGSLFGLVGINGAGKSTLLRTLSGVFAPDEGSVMIDGQSVFQNEKIKQDVLFLPDEPFFTPLTNGDDVAALYKTFYNFDNKLFKEFIAAYKLSLKMPLRTFSKGMKRRLFVSLAFASNPKYLFLDEVFDGIDPAARLIFKQGLIEMHRRNNTTCVIASHSLRELEDICDSFALIDGKTIRSTGGVAGSIESLTKLQIAFKDPISALHFKDIEHLSFTTTGRIATVVFSGDRQEFLKNIALLNPLVIDELPVDFEEYFIHEISTKKVSPLDSEGQHSFLRDSSLFRHSSEEGELMQQQENDFREGGQD